MKKILFVLTSHARQGASGKPTGFYLSEVTHPHKVLVEHGFLIDFVSPQGGQAPMDGLDLEDAINESFLANPHCVYQIEHTSKPEEIDPHNYLGIYYAGGHGTMWDLPDNLTLASLTASIYEQGGVVGAVCHGLAGLVNVKLSNGQYLVASKAVTSFTNDEEQAVGASTIVPFLLESKLQERGAYYRKAPNFEPHVVISERLVTGQNPASAAGVGEEMLRLLTIASS